MQKLAIGLYSGGLDSRLAARLMVEQGFRVILVKFVSPLFEDRQIFPDFLPAESFCVHKVALGIDFLQMLQSPEYGYGKNLNPCIDCKIFMLKKTREILKESSGAFIFTGEVVGQRPMSQRKDALRIIERDSGLDGYLLRPLSAQLLPPTLAEESGLINREALFAISGRSRKRQIELAAKFGIVDYPSPAGGCLLTDANFARRFKAILEDAQVTMEDLPLLKVGRHFLIRPGVMLIVGRNRSENQQLLAKIKNNCWIFQVINAPGPVSLAWGKLEEADFQLAASITARYSDAKAKDNIPVSFELKGVGQPQIMEVSPVEDCLLEEYRI